MGRHINTGLVLACTALIVGYAPPAHAYLDPGTGSMILQIIIATVTGSIFLLKIYWRRVKAFFTGQPVDEESAAPDTAPDGQD